MRSGQELKCDFFLCMCGMSGFGERVKELYSTKATVKDGPGAVLHGLFGRSGTG